MKKPYQLIPIVMLMSCVSVCSAQIVSNGDFEIPQVTATLAIYSPTNAVWVFSAVAGIISPPGYANGASFQAPTSPSGSQLGFLQESNATMSQVITLPATGIYRISYQDAGRPLCSCGAGGDTIYQVLMDTNVIAQVSTESLQPWTPEAFTFTAKAGQHNLTFKILSTLAYDDTAFFDAISIEPEIPVLEISMISGIPAVEILGPSGTTNRLEFTDDLSTNNPWNVITNIILTPTPTLILDYSATNISQRYYRAKLLP